MYLKSISLENFRKFRTEDNIIEFVDAKDYKKDENINIAPKTTLIVGKNNSGKTTVVEALKKLITPTGFCATDFNFNYLKELLELYTLEYLECDEIKKTPTLTFALTIVIDSNEEDLLTNILPFMTIGDVKESEVQIIAKWTTKNNELFLNSVKKFVSCSDNYKSQKFDRFLKLINEEEFTLLYFNSENEKRDGFSLKKLVDLESIAANNVNGEDCLSKSFSKIVDYRYNYIIKNQGGSVITQLDEEIISINEKLTEHISNEHTGSINSSLGKMVSGEKCQVLLKSDLSFQTLLKSVLKYEYIEGQNNIPEKQFGLGYTNLMMIIADIITYMEKYPESSFNSQINLISIEEPETFMHPQMQELFIKNINEMIASLLEDKEKHVNSQILITTHSPHILNSKIHEGNTFDNINYITSKKNIARAICLKDKMLIDDESGARTNRGRWKKIQNLKFLKKHIKFKVSELFFADAIIFVEGITEYTLLQYYLNADYRFNKHYISLILVDGAHAKVYEKLIYALGVPTLIITDIDIKRQKFEKNETDLNHPGQVPCYLQIDDANIANRLSTNSTLSYFYRNANVKTIIEGEYKVNDNLMITCQKQKINGFYPTSFEEALILKNYKNDILQDVLKKVKPDIYDEIVATGGIIKNSYKLQKKLSDAKSDFANEMLFKILTKDDQSQVPLLPEYIMDGLQFIQEQLGGQHYGL